VPAPQTPPQPPDSPQEQPQRPRPRSRRTGSRLYSPGSDATTRRLVTANERRARRERQQPGDDSAQTPEPSELAESGAASTAVKTASTTTPGPEADELETDDLDADETDTDETDTDETDADETDTDETDTDESAEDIAKARAERRRKAREIRENRRSPVLPVALGIATLVLGGLAAWFGTEAHSLTSSPAAGNSALTNAAETSAVRSQVSSAVTSLFSYNYAKPGPTTRAASRLLTGPAVRQYAKLFTQVHKDAPSQKLVVKTSVNSAGVEMLAGDQARVLVFATETDTKAGGGQPASVGAMLAVNVVRQGNTWKIEGIDTF
jgi:Mce-associated membrane protein